MASLSPFNAEHLLDSAPVTLFRINRDYRIDYVNACGAAEYGRRPEEILGRRCDELGMPDDLYRRWHDELDAVFATGDARDFEFFRTYTVPQRLIEFRMVPQRDARGTVTAVLIAAMTLDKVHRLRAELQSQEELFRSFMDHSPAMAWLRDDRSRYVFLNRAYLQRCGLKLEDRIGKRPSDVWPAEVADKFLRNDRAVLDGGQPVTVIEEAPDPDGTVRHWFNVKFPIISGDGRRFVGGMGLDVTAERKAEARLARAQKLESLSLLAAGAAHDFNNYLSVVLGNAALARQGHEADVDLCEHLHDIEAAGQQMAALCQQMLAFAGRGGGEPRRLDVNALIGETLRLMRPLIPRDVAIHYELEPDVGPITADEMQFRQVAMNLVINACEAMAGRRGTVTLATRQLELDAAGCEARSLSGTSARCVEMTVADDGPGMDTMTCQRAFEPFFTTKPHGRGIGLAAVEGIVRAHGGAVAVAAEPGRGCTFTVLWPASL